MAASVPPAPRAPFYDSKALKEHVQAVYVFSETHGIAAGMSALEDLWNVPADKMMALPARTNSGQLGAFAVEWMSTFPFVDLNAQQVIVDDVAICNDGFSLIVWARWFGKCNGQLKSRDGSVVDVAGREFKDYRYAYKLTFDKDSKQLVMFEGLADTAELGRLLGSPACAVAQAVSPLYTQ